MGSVFNEEGMTPIRQNLRNNIPKPEQIFWEKVRSRQFYGYKFRRQFSVGRYVLDFYCPKLKLGVEIDGDSHFRKRALVYDKEREQAISDVGITIVRFSNREVMGNMRGVLEKLEKFLPR